jgi:hypothetical protein
LHWFRGENIRRGFLSQRGDENPIANRWQARWHSPVIFAAAARSPRFSGGTIGGGVDAKQRSILNIDPAIFAT